MKRILLWTVGVLLAAVVIALIAFRASPWPAAWVIATLWGREGERLSTALARHVPSNVSSRRDLAYGPGEDERFDLHRPAQTDVALPTIVWIHGGGYVSGSKEAVANYLRILASHGFTVVGIGYSIGPGHAYPKPVVQANAALGYLSTHASALGIDPRALVLAGDSAGAQIAAQVAMLTTDPRYATEIGIAPTLDRAQVRGTILGSGVFDFTRFRYDGPGALFTNTFLRAYSGRRHFLDDERFMRGSITPNLSAAFPPSFVTSGNADPLEGQAHRLVERLAERGIDHESLFFPPDHEPAQPHVYFFDLDSDEGRRALSSMVAFARRQVDAAPAAP